MIKTVIFDLDGVIVTTDELHYQAWKQMADKIGVYFDKQINNRLRGVSRMQSLEIILEKSSKKYSDDEKQELAKFKNDIYVSLLDNLTHKDILPHVEELIYELKKRNIRVAIGSSSKNTKKILLKLGLLETFDFISDGNNITRSKPFPDVFKYVSDSLELNPHECLVIEDAKAGIEAGNKALMKTCAISDAYGYELADVSIKDILDVLKYLEKECEQNV